VKILAAEAVLKIREAEEKGGEMIKDAGAEAREILRKAEADGVLMKNGVAQEAEREKLRIISEAEATAAKESAKLEDKNKSELYEMRTPSGQKLTDAVALVVKSVV
jgi:vacuolar-type H+-ATPase subunit H